MDLSFYKLRLFQSDFIVISRGNDLPMPDAFAATTARRLSRRHQGIGATGVLYPDRSDTTDLTTIRYFDRFGNRRKLSADALACAARYLFDSGRFDGNTVRFENEGIPVSVDVIDSRQFRLTLGVPKRIDRGEELDLAPDSDYTERVFIEDRTYTVTRIDLLRRCSVFLPAPNRASVKVLDARFQELGVMSDSTRVYVFPRTPDTISTRYWPHDVEVDYISIVSCAAVASLSAGFSEGIVLVKHGSDSAFIEWGAISRLVTATVSPEYVFSGDVSVDDE